jgi:uncharacterized protein
MDSSVGTSRVATVTPAVGEGEATMAGRFEVYSDKAGKFRFRLKASNGQVVASGEAYESKAAAKDGCEAVQRAANGAEIVETDD